MTEHRARSRRWSPGRIRAAAWIASGAAALASGAALTAAPQPAIADARAGAARPAPARRVVERHVIRRIIVVEAAPSAPTDVPTIVVQAPAPVTQAAPSAPAPTTSTGGS